MGRAYKVWCGIAKAITPKMTTIWTSEFDGEPSVFCPNHAGAFGPIDMCIHFDNCEHCHPWFNAAVMDPKLVPAYVRQDYWWKPGCFFEPILTRTLPYMAAAVLPPILRTVPGVPVYHDIQVIKTFRQSVALLKQGEHLVIFPQQPSGYLSHFMTLNKGFLQLAPMAYRSLGLKLKFYPVHIDYKKHTLTVGLPVQYDPDVKLAEQEERLLA
ncbi:MAG: hypothetical protein RR696_09805, partial [Clostridia bacterium]